MTHIEALKQALEALERGETELRWKAITAIKKALAQPEQEPVACHPKHPPPECKTEEEKTAFAFGWWKALEAQRQEIVGSARCPRCWEPITPPQRKPLTDEEIKDVAASCMWWVREQDILDDAIELARAIEAAVWEKQK